MAEVDQEFDELLSAYVDGELSADEELRVRQRLETEPQLVAAVEALRADRRARAALWQSCEPGEAAVQRLIDRVDRAIDRQTVWSHRLTQIRTFGAAAACVVLGILIGRVTLGPGGSGNAIAPVLSPGNTVPGQTVVAPILTPAPAQVRIVDGRGRATVQRFNSVQEAQRFIQDLQQLQAEQEQIQNGGGAIVPASTERF